MRRTLVVSSWEGVKDGFTTNDNARSTRPSNEAAEYMGYNYAMLGFTPHGPWRELRKITTLQILCNTRLDALKHVRATEIDMRVKNLDRLWSMNGRSPVPVDLKQWCGDLTLDIACRMVVGKPCFDGADHVGGGGDGDSEGRRFPKAMSRFGLLCLMWFLYSSGLILRAPGARHEGYCQGT